MNGKRPEMLFADPGDRGKGPGRRLGRYGAEQCGVSEVAANGQSLQDNGRLSAWGSARTEPDGQGKPYPFLDLRRGESLPREDGNELD